LGNRGVQISYSVVHWNLELQEREVIPISNSEGTAAEGNNEDDEIETRPKAALTFGG